VGVSHLEVRQRGDFGVWSRVQKGEVTHCLRGEIGELSFHMRGKTELYSILRSIAWKVFWRM
jgi:hypothetical protein